MADESAEPPPQAPPDGETAGPSAVRTRRERRDARARERHLGRYAPPSSSQQGATSAARRGDSRRASSRARPARPTERVFAPSARTGYTPSTYPALCPSGPGHAMVREWFTPDVQVYCDHLNTIQGSYSRTPQWTAFTGELAQALGIAAGTQEVRRFSAAFRGVSLLALTQHVMFAQRNAESNTPTITGLAAAQIIIPRAVAAVTSQYGAFKSDNLGARFIVFDLGSFMSACIRAAGFIVPPFGEVVPDATAIERIIDRWWIPTSATCLNFRYVVACRIASYYEEVTREVIPVKVVAEDMFPSEPHAVVPAWYDALRHCIPEPGRRHDLDVFIMSPAPATAAAAANLFTRAVGGRRLEVLKLMWERPSAQHCAWGANPGATLTRVLHIWADFESAMRRFIATVNLSDTRQTASGSPLQYSVVDTASRGATSALRSMIGANAASSSLALAFPPLCYHDARREFCVVNATTTAMDEVVARWITADVATTPLVAAQF